MFGSARQEVAGVVEYKRLVFDGTDAAEVEPLVEARDATFQGAKLYGPTPKTENRGRFR